MNEEINIKDLVDRILTARNTEFGNFIQKELFGVATNYQPQETSLTYEGLLKMIEPFQKEDDKETKKYGAPLRDLTYIFPGIRNKNKKRKLRPKPEFLEVFLTCRSLGWNWKLSEWVDQIYSIPPLKPYRSIFEL